MIGQPGVAGMLLIFEFRKHMCVMLAVETTMHERSMQIVFR